MATDPKTPAADLELEDINRQIFKIIYTLNEKFKGEADFAVLKLRTATEDIHRIRVNQTAKHLEK
jgi:hypothetical protein